MTLSAAFGVLRDYGCPSEEWCPYPLAGAPPDEATRHSRDQAGGFGARPVYGSLEAMRALSLGYPLVLGTVARHGGPHATVIGGYDERRGVFREDNSWGDSWGIDGYGEIAIPALDSDYVLGLWAVTWSPSPSEDYAHEILRTHHLGPPRGLHTRDAA
jgi:hypothetical protein